MIFVAGTFTVSCSATDNAGNTASALANYAVEYNICLLYDYTKSHKAGSTVPVKLQLCDANRADHSSAAVIVHATGVWQFDNSASAVLDDSGAANAPDYDFRFDPSLGPTGGYIFNLSTKNGYSTGSYKLTFTAGGVSEAIYFAPFDIR